MESSPQAIGSTTTIFNLNDDCLREVFVLMDLSELITVADVCAHFRENAVQLDRLKMKIKKLRLHMKSPMKDFSMLRIFGASIETVKLNGECRREARQAKYQKQIIELVRPYSVGILIKLKLCCFDIFDENAILLLPLLARVNSLILSFCHIGKLFSEKIASCSLELRSLSIQLSSKPNFGQMCQRFPKLESISCCHEWDDENGDIEEFVKWNPQLKNIHVTYSYQTLGYDTNSYENKNHITNFGRLHELESFKLCGIRDRLCTCPCFG